MRNKGLTVVEMLTVVVVMAIIIGLIAPAGVAIMDKAKETKQRAQFTAMNIAIESFRNDHGYYPPSDNDDNDYCGAQKLAEAMVGYDLFGFHPDSDFNSDGKSDDGSEDYYPDNLTEDDIKERVEPYLKIETTQAVPFTDDPDLGEGYFDSSSYGLSSRLVLCDTYKRYNPNLQKKTGTPILYYKARTNKVQFDKTPYEDQIFDYMDNARLIFEGTPDGQNHEKFTPDNFYDRDEYQLVNDDITNLKVPHNKDSFILISAGKDGLYGTDDDIFNFEKD